MSLPLSPCEIWFDSFSSYLGIWILLPWLCWLLVHHHVLDSRFRFVWCCCSPFMPVHPDLILHVGFLIYDLHPFGVIFLVLCELPTSLVLGLLASSLSCTVVPFRFYWPFPSGFSLTSSILVSFISLALGLPFPSAKGVWVVGCCGCLVQDSASNV